MGRISIWGAKGLGGSVEDSRGHGDKENLAGDYCHVSHQQESKLKPK